MSETLRDLTNYLDGYLCIEAVRDASLNGLQVEAGDAVARVAIAVDASRATIDAAVARECELLLVHHGLFWGQAERLTGMIGSRVGECFRSGLSVYAAHLPLDMHPEVGNNALLARALGAEPEGVFARYEGVEIGTLAAFDAAVPLAELAGRLAAAGCDEQVMWAFGADPVRRLAVLTGSGCSALSEAIAAGAECFITGESRHSAYHEAREGAINCIFAGHYATETFGVRAVGEHLAKRFDVSTEWIDLPTGI